MDIPTLFLYIVAVGVVMMAPGVSMLLALNNGGAHGMRVAAFGMAGAALSDLTCGGLISLDTSIGGKSTDRGIMYEQ